MFDSAMTQLACSFGSYVWWNDWSGSWLHRECHGWNIAFYSYICPKTFCLNLTQFWTWHHVRTAINLQNTRSVLAALSRSHWAVTDQKHSFPFLMQQRAIRAEHCEPVSLHVNGASQKSKMVWLRFHNCYEFIIVIILLIYVDILIECLRDFFSIL